MKKIILFILLLCHIQMYGYTNYTKLEIKNVYYICIDIIPQKNYSTKFDIILDINDSLSLDISNCPNFIHSVLRNSQYVPRCWNEEVFTEYYGDSCRNSKNTFRREFYRQMKRLENIVRIKLTSGEYVVISYMKIKGIFAHYDREINFSEGLYSRYYPEVSKPFVPFAITEYLESENIPVWKKDIDGNDIFFIEDMEY